MPAPEKGTLTVAKKLLQRFAVFALVSALVLGAAVAFTPNALAAPAHSPGRSIPLENCIPGSYVKVSASPNPQDNQHPVHITIQWGCSLEATDGFDVYLYYGDGQTDNYTCGLNCSSGTIYFDHIYAAPYRGSKTYSIYATGTPTDGTQSITSNTVHETIVYACCIVQQRG
jgi:hypothetical protein